MNTEMLYSYIIDTSGNVLYHPDQKLKASSISQLEFPKDPEGTEAKDFNKTILPLFENQRTKTDSYKKNGDEMKISVTPILMELEEGTKYQHVASVGVVLRKRSLESKFNTLQDDCKSMLILELYLSIIFLVLVGILCILLTDKITASVVAPIDHLLTILKRMKNDDLGMDILESYKPSPPEVACLYGVFDKLRVILRFNKLQEGNSTQALMIYSQALNLFKSFGNEKAMEFCYRELGNICATSEL